MTILSQDITKKQFINSFQTVSHFFKENIIDNMEKLISSTNLQQFDKFAHKHSFIFTDPQGSAQTLQQFLKLDYHIQKNFFLFASMKVLLKMVGSVFYFI